MIKIERFPAAACTSSVAAALVLFAASAGPSLAAASFACAAWPTQTCHYALVKDGGVRERFVLRNGARVESPDVQPGDGYMMSVNFDPPEAEASCSQSPRPELKRSRWCRVGQVKAGVNP